MDMSKLPSIPFSARQTGVALLIALVSAAAVVLVYHYATGPKSDPGA